MVFTVNSYAKEVSVSGIIKEKGNGHEITDATIINGSNREQYVNVGDNGHFQIKLEDTTKNIIIRSDHYYDKTVDLSTLNLAKENSIYLELLPDIAGSGIIRAKKKQEVSQTNLSQDELRYTAGGGGDAVRAIQTLPSVSPSSVGSANIVVRGGDPGDNKYFYDDLELPFIFHFGGVNTVIPTKMIDSVDFYPGGFSAQYGDATGGIIQLNSKNSIPQRFSGDVEGGLIQSGIYLEGNFLGEKKDVEGTDNPVPSSQTSEDEGKIGYRMGFRRTYFELYAPIINKNSDVDFYTYPQSTDYQFVLDGKVKDGTWQIYLLGASDKLGVLGNFGDGLDSSGQSSFNYSNYYETSGVKYSKNLGNGYGLQVSFQQLYNTIDQNFSNNSVVYDVYSYALKTAITKNFNENNFVTFGVIPKYEMDKLHLNVFQLPAPGAGSQSFDPYTAPRVQNEQTIESYYGNGFVDFNLKPIDNLLINPGVNFLKGTHAQQFAADPRLGARYEFIPGQTVKAAAGYYSERPEPQYDAPVYGNPNLDLERTTQFVLGYETKIFTDWSIDVQGWDKQSHNLVGPAVSNPANKYENSVSFRATGVDFFLKKQFTGRFYGWLSYSYSKSEKQDPGTGIWRYSDYDRTNNINLVANAKVTNRWLVGTRVQYMTGTPYSTVGGGVFNQNTGQYVAANDGQSYLVNKNDGRFPAFFQMDVRSDYDFLFDSWKLDFYTEIDNLTNQKNIAQINYNRDYSQQLNVYSFPILPSIGVIASF